MFVQRLWRLQEIASAVAAAKKRNLLTKGGKLCVASMAADVRKPAHSTHFDDTRSRRSWLQINAVNVRPPYVHVCMCVCAYNVYYV